MSAPPVAHAFVGILPCGKASFIDVDADLTDKDRDLRQERYRDMMYVLRKPGGIIKRAPLEEARAIDLCFGCDACKAPA